MGPKGCPRCLQGLKPTNTVAQLAAICMLPIYKTAPNEAPVMTPQGVLPAGGAERCGILASDVATILPSAVLSRPVVSQVVH